MRKYIKWSSCKEARQNTRRSRYQKRTNKKALECVPAKQEVFIADKDIHRAIAKVFMYWGKGFNRIPMPLENLIDFVMQDLHMDGWKDRLRVALLIRNAD